jgi:hypothetical protein
MISCEELSFGARGSVRDVAASAVRRFIKPVPGAVSLPDRVHVVIGDNMLSVDGPVIAGEKP